jgi:hypothetical protein
LISIAFKPYSDPPPQITSVCPVIAAAEEDSSNATAAQSALIGMRT